MKKQVRIYYSGSVQGVGFRFTAKSIANNLGVTGWIKNLSDGRVEVVAQAQEDVLKDFLARIDKTFSNYIHDTDMDWLIASGKFKDFSIKF